MVLFLLVELDCVVPGQCLGIPQNHCSTFCPGGPGGLRRQAGEPDGAAMANFEAGVYPNLEKFLFHRKILTINISLFLVTVKLFINVAPGDSIIPV